jgi:hypothetical protein
MSSQLKFGIFIPLIGSYRADGKSRFPGRARVRNFGEHFSELEIRKDVRTYGRTPNPEKDSNSNRQNTDETSGLTGGTACLNLLSHRSQSDRRELMNRVYIAVLGIGVGLAAAAAEQETAIDTQRSSITIHVGKAGILSAAAHEHWVNAPIASGTVDDTSATPGVRVCC